MAEEMADVALHSTSESNINFFCDMYKVLSAWEPGNLFYSPLSLQVILILVYYGAGGKTARQLRESLHLVDNDVVVEQGIEATMRHLNASEDVLLDIANGIYLHAGFTVKKRFIESAAKFLAGVKEVDFQTPEGARKIINDWVEMKTHDKIKDIIPSGILNGLTRMVLVNAVYFKAEWQEKFNKEETAPMTFHLADGSRKNVEMMHMKNQFKHGMSHVLDSQVLELPYKGGQLVMMIFLPTQVNGLFDLESKLVNLNLQNLMSNKFTKDVIVYLPKFKMEYGKELSGILQELGMTQMFIKDAANFTGIASKPLHVDKVLLKAFVEVSETGTEAAAATCDCAVDASLSARRELVAPVVFKADHPFLFFILDKQTQLILFAGRYAAPPL